MIELANVTKSYGGQTVLSDVSVRIHPGEHVGVVGPNGAGKTTLFELATGGSSPDRGKVVVRKGCRLGYVRQELAAHAVSADLLDYAADPLPDLRETGLSIEHCEQRLAEQPPPADREALLRRLGELQTRFETLGGYEVRHRAETTLSGLGFGTEEFGRPFRNFSGGWQLRAELARALVADPELLLLDEPSNYLDLPAIEWLRRYLRDFQGTLLLISHDRYLLTSLTSVTLEVAAARVEKYAGNYAYYHREKQLRQEQRVAERRNQDRKRVQAERFIERFRAKNTKASQVQSRIKMLERMGTVEVPHTATSAGRIRLAPPPHCGQEIMRLDDAGLTYDGRQWVLRHANVRVSRGDKIAFHGLNGTGKTTLLRAMAGEMPLGEGSRTVGHKVVIGYQSQEFADTMLPTRTVFDVVRAVSAAPSDTEVRTLLGGFGFSGDAVEKRVQILSGGEKVRLAFARLLIRPPSLLLLDEPTTHLDIASREALESALHDYPGTICFVSHDTEFVRRVATSMLIMTPPGVTPFGFDYDYYLRKTAEDAKPAGDPPPRRRDGDTGDRKAQRRERARQREALAPQRRELRGRLRRAEKTADRLEAEQRELLAELESDTPSTNLSGISRRLTDIQAELAEATRLWEEAAQALEDLSAE